MEAGTDPAGRTVFRRRVGATSVALGVLVILGLVVVNARREDGATGAPVASIPTTTTTTTTTSSNQPAIDDSVEPSLAPISEPRSTTSTERPMSCIDQGLDAILAVMRSGPIPIDVDLVPNLDALVTLGDRAVAGNITSMVRERGQFSDWTTLDIEVTETLAAPPLDEIVARISFASSGTFSDDAEDLADPIASPVAVVGVRFVAVLNRFPDAPGGWTNMVQGLSIACNNFSPLVGVLAPFPETSTESITDIADDVRAMRRIAATPSETVMRPIVDRDLCAPTSPAPFTRDFDSPVTFFAKPSDFPVPIQVFADPDLGPAGPIVMVMRFRDRDDSIGSAEPMGENAMQVQIFESGAGEARWTAEDGTTGYLRSRGIDDWGSLVKLIGIAIPRDLDAPNPGFDFFANPDGQRHARVKGRLELLHEAMNTDLTGSFANTECIVESTGFVYQVSRTSGDDVLQFASVLDRPPPIEVGISGDSVIMISGNADEMAPTVADVREATDDEWVNLLAID